MPMLYCSETCVVSQTTKSAFFVACTLRLFFKQFYAFFYWTPVDERSSSPCDTHGSCRAATSGVNIDESEAWSTPELGAQVRYAQTRVHVRLANAAPFVLLLLALLRLAAAAARSRQRGRLRIVEVELGATSAAAWPASTHLHRKHIT